MSLEYQDDGESKNEKKMIMMMKKKKMMMIYLDEKMKKCLKLKRKWSDHLLAR